MCLRQLPRTAKAMRQDELVCTGFLYVRPSPSARTSLGVPEHSSKFEKKRKTIWLARGSARGERAYSLSSPSWQFEDSYRVLERLVSLSDAAPSAAGREAHKLAHSVLLQRHAA